MTMDDWYYIVFNKKGGGQCVDVVNFSPNVDPIPWCEAIIEAQAKGKPSMAGQGYDHSKEQKVSYEKPRKMIIQD